MKEHSAGVKAISRWFTTGGRRIRNHEPARVRSRGVRPLPGSFVIDARGPVVSSHTLLNHRLMAEIPPGFSFYTAPASTNRSFAAACSGDNWLIYTPVASSKPASEVTRGSNSIRQ